MQSVTSHPQIGELLIELDNIESLKIRGALAAVGVVLPEVLMASRPDIVARSHYQSAPILLREGTCIELYWNILLALDRELWGSNLLLANHQSFQLLFTLQERMDREVFPILEASLLSYVE
ncbi:MAG: hypothetical protein KDD70_11620, partial [Bdellovibrionales bacterium]|nr:hypothetical protein [Bdellovibrionales bacterium]